MAHEQGNRGNKTMTERGRLIYDHLFDMNNLFVFHNGYLEESE